jgi:hypothetical protein
MLLGKERMGDNLLDGRITRESFHVGIKKAMAASESATYTQQQRVDIYIKIEEAVQKAIMDNKPLPYKISPNYGVGG